MHWEFLGTVFTTPPAWVVEELGTTPGDFWAPDISYFNGRYHLYYAASQFATNNSVIGLATAKTLDPASPDYGWTDEGMVLRSTPGEDDFNAIDPDVVFDERGRLWMAFGSFWSGLKLRRLDPDRADRRGRRRVPRTVSAYFPYKEDLAFPNVEEDFAAFDARLRDRLPGETGDRRAREFIRSLLEEGEPRAS